MNDDINNKWKVQDRQQQFIPDLSRSVKKGINSITGNSHGAKQIHWYMIVEEIIKMAEKIQRVKQIKKDKQYRSAN